LLGFSPFRKRSARGEAEGIGEGRAVGLVVGIVSPWLAMHVRKAMNAAAPPPKPPRPKPPLGRSDAHACRAFIIAALALGRTVGRTVGRALGRAVGTVTPCCCRQVTYALALGLGEAAAVAAAVGVADVPHPEASTATKALPAMTPETRAARSAFLGAHERGNSLLGTEFSSGHRSAPRSPKGAGLPVAANAAAQSNLAGQLERRLRLRCFFAKDAEALLPRFCAPAHQMAGCRSRHGRAASN
jgi:hypothetical protein